MYESNTLMRRANTAILRENLKVPIPTMNEVLEK